ncbi:MAG: lysophospholipid acyltransferase family protein [Desulfobacterales bacterium]|jgi:KDO2-lipid IV(A) lauroyltransferase|nr:lysophospholipid acyltransferase family protein [Desulfobacterales bacterium]
MMNLKVCWYKKLYLALFYVFARTTPRFWQQWQNAAVSPLFFLFWPRIRRALARNLSVILNRPADDPVVIQTARRAVSNYGLYLTDYVQMNRLKRHLLPEQYGAHHMMAALNEGNGAILITPHLGNWELGGVTFAARGKSIYALTLKDTEANVQDFRDSMRASLGIKTVHIDTVDSWGTSIKLATLLRQNEIIAMLGDRWEGGKQVTVRFFGKKTLFPSGAAALALATGAPIIPAFTIMKPRGDYLAWMEAPICVRRIPNVSTLTLLTEKTQELAAVFERIIARYPDQWYHFFDFWEKYGC